MRIAELIAGLFAALLIVGAGGSLVYMVLERTQPPTPAGRQLKAWAEEHGYAEYRLNKSTGEIEYFVDVDNLPRGQLTKADIRSYKIRIGTLLEDGLVFDKGISFVRTVTPSGRVITWQWRDVVWEPIGSYSINHAVPHREATDEKDD
jgi:hypothetical protein